ncbi:hypothetical protein MTR_7g053380 [Medicago truncatula]|uniref:Uncharacterized protein n=1 Tax=Medicago truncatula TaxID=3880 RepID=A0A072TYN9_MEDTR|nr:hypothetical protein MTR_7g053380 [Medicago truncatula]
MYQFQNIVRLSMEKGFARQRRTSKEKVKDTRQDSLQMVTTKRIGVHQATIGTQAVETEEDDEEVVEREQKSNFSAVVNCCRVFNGS